MSIVLFIIGAVLILLGFQAGAIYRDPAHELYLMGRCYVFGGILVVMGGFCIVGGVLL